MSGLLVASLGMLALIAIALFIGASMDTEAQRREGRRLAEERRRWLLTQRACDGRPAGLCADCPLRGLS
jgi:hypothetical protein